ncbi:MAG: glycosyltransferase family 4 protein [Terriglobales bacterium]
MPASIRLFFVGLALSALCTGITVWVARKNGWLFHPREERWNRKPAAKFGGVAILAALIASASVLPLSREFWVVLLLTVGMGMIGLADDLWSLRPLWKFSAQVLLAALAAYLGVVYPLTYSLTANVAFTVLWLVGLTNAFNLLDNMDGLAAGVAIVALLNLLFVTGLPDDGPRLLLAMVGVLAGFLVFNFQPAKIFMGDTGSLSIGFFLAAISILGAQKLATTFSVLFVPGLMLFLPIFDTALVMVTRRLSGRAISAGAKDHSSHRLVTLGLSERGAVLTLYMISAASGTVAYLWKRVWPEAGPGFMLLFLLIAGLFWMYLAKIQLPKDWLSQTNVFTFVLPEFLQSVMTAAAMMFTDVVLILLSLYISFLLRFSGVPRQTLSSFFLAAALAVGIKLPLLAIFGVYRRAWAVRSLRDIYAIVKASVIGMLTLVTALTFTTRFREASRTVFLMDCVMTVVLLCFARVSKHVFDDVLPRSERRGFLIFGGQSAEFFVHYFAWKYPDDQVLAVATAAEAITTPIGRTPIIPSEEGLEALAAGSVTAVYLLPDCDGQVRKAVLVECARAGIKANEFDVSILPAAQARSVAAGTE